MTSLVEIEGVGEAQAQKLTAAGIASVEALLEHGATPKDRDEVAQRSGVGGTLILKWVNHADLFRVKGVGGEYAELLEGSGVDSVPELAQRNSANLAAKMAEVNARKHLVRQVPSEGQVARWVEEAKTLPRVVMH
jgi:predicted flap endonuclease-1-like 5' DNA nuclease